MDAVTLFNSKAPGIIARLRGDFNQLSAEDGQAIVGNAGHECLGFTKLQEMRPTVKGSRGGWGWMQWTGPRRRAFEAYCKRNSLDPKSDKANYAWLFLELKSSERKAINLTRAAQGLFAKVRAFEKAFLRAGVKHYDQREAWALKAKIAYEAAGSPVEGTPAIEKHAALADEAEASDARSAAAGKGAVTSGVGGGVVTVTGGTMQLADWLLIGGFALLVVGVVAFFVLKMRSEGKRADALAEEAEMIEGAIA